MLRVFLDWRWYRIELTRWIMATELNEISQPLAVDRWRKSITTDPNQLRSVQNLAWILDSALPIPGTRFRVGLDPLIGLIPGFGDLIGMVIGLYIITTAERAGVSRAVLMRMVGNVGVDAAVGAVPFAGDLLDATWRANAKNARLLEQALADPDRTHRNNRWTLFLAAFAVVTITVLGLALAIALAVLVVRQFS